MKYLKTYENFNEQDLGRFGQKEMDINDPENNIQSFDEYPEDEYPEDEYPEDEYPEDKYPEDEYPEDEYPEDEYPEDEDDEFSDEEKNRIEDRKIWGDERMVESKKRSIKKEDKCKYNKDKKEDKCGPNCKCKDNKEKPKSNGLTASQKKLPKPLQDAILKKQKK